MCPINATCSAEEDALTRMTSTSIRHGANIHMVVQQLEKVRGEMKDIDTDGLSSTKFRIVNRKDYQSKHEIIEVVI